MFQRLRQTLVDDTLDDPAAMLEDDGQGTPGRPSGPPSPAAPDLAALPIIGITRRRMAGLVGALLAAWIIILFARQVGEASAATTRADQIATGNTERQAQVAALERELEAIARQRYIVQQARGYGLGSEREVSFSLVGDAPALPEDAPGSAAVRVGATIDDVTPLERWLTVLFGPSD